MTGTFIVYNEDTGQYCLIILPDLDIAKVHLTKLTGGEAADRVNKRVLQ